MEQLWWMKVTWATIPALGSFPKLSRHRSAGLNLPDGEHAPESYRTECHWLLLRDRLKTLACWHGHSSAGSAPWKAPS